MMKKIFIIAEIGINHNGDLGIARDLINVAVDVGADAVKFQKRTIDLVYTQKFMDRSRVSPWGTTQREQKEGLEFGLDDYTEIDKYCKEKGIEWFASAWDLESQKFLNQFNLKHNKIASAMIVYEELYQAVASEGKHTFISTGMTNEEDITKVVEIFQNANCPFELMHCISTYPMNDEDANLNTINTLREKYGCDVGYSGHEVGLAVSLAAAALGITSLERHITLDRSMYGSDQAASLTPEGLKQLVGGVRKIEQAMGNGQLGILKKEKHLSEGKMPIYKLIGNIILTKFHNLLLNTNFTDTHSGFWAYRIKNFKDKLYSLTTNGFNFDQQLRFQYIYKKQNISEIPIATIYADERSQLHIVYAIRFFFETTIFFLIKMKIINHKTVKYLSKRKS